MIRDSRFANFEYKCYREIMETEGLYHLGTQETLISNLGTEAQQVLVERMHKVLKRDAKDRHGTIEEQDLMSIQHAVEFLKKLLGQYAESDSNVYLSYCDGFPGPIEFELMIERHTQISFCIDAFGLVRHITIYPKEEMESDEFLSMLTQVCKKS